MEKITVITVCRNAESTIETTIKSVLEQKYPNVEYIIIDGASTDGTLSILEKFGVRYYSEPDNGIYDAMNKGLKIASGDWVSFINSGDAFVDEYVISNIFMKGKNDGDTWPEYIKLIGGDVYLSNGQEKRLVKSKKVSSIFHNNIFCHQSTFTRLGIFAPVLRNKESLPWSFDLRYKIAADYNLFYNIIDKYGPNSVFCIDSPISLFDTTNSFSEKNTRIMYREYLEIQSRHIDSHWFKELIKYVINPYYPKIDEPKEGWRRVYQKFRK